MTDADYFDRLYAESEDPWNLAEHAYEHRKYEITLASLPRQTYARGFEPGCSIGVLTRGLAARCDDLLATDPVAVPLARARRDVPDAHVRFEQGRVPDDWPDHELDLVVLSEMLYYLSAADRFAVQERVTDTLAPDGHLVLVHWRHPFEAARCTGDEAHAEIRTRSGLTTLVEHVETDFRLEVLGRG